MPTAYALLVALGLTALVVLVELLRLSKAERVPACFTIQSAIYFAIQFVGNAVATLLAIKALSAEQANGVPDSWIVFFSAFLGVFAFEGILSNTNITFFNKNALAFQEWIAKAKDPAIEKTIRKNADLSNSELYTAAAKLKAVRDDELNTYIDNKFGAGTAAKLRDEAQKGGSDPQLYLALDFASRARGEAIAIIKRLHA